MSNSHNAISERAYYQWVDAEAIRYIRTEGVERELIPHGAMAMMDDPLRTYFRPMHNLFVELTTDVQNAVLEKVGCSFQVVPLPVRFTSFVREQLIERAQKAFPDDDKDAVRICITDLWRYATDDCDELWHWKYTVPAMQDEHDDIVNKVHAILSSDDGFSQLQAVRLHLSKLYHAGETHLIMEARLLAGLYLRALSVGFGTEAGVRDRIPDIYDLRLDRGLGDATPRPLDEDHYLALLYEVYSNVVLPSRSVLRQTP